MTRLTLLFTLVALVTLADIDTAQAQNPEEIAQRCVAEVNQTVERCQRAAAAELRECLPRIRRLVEAGEIEEAHAVARRCAASAEQRTGRCVEHVRSVCRRCITLLVSLGAPELARRVNFTCETAIVQLRHILQREKNALQQALHG